MFVIRYGTYSFFSNKFGNMYYCKSLDSAIKKLQRLLDEDQTVDVNITEEMIFQLNEWIKKRKKSVNVGRFQFVREYEDDFAFELYEEELI